MLPFMPELPEVETVRRGLIDVLQGQTLCRVEVNRPDLRRPFPARLKERLEGRVVTGLGRRAKYLLLTLDDGWVLLAHLGMSGRFVVDPPEPWRAGPHDHVVFATTERRRVVFQDPRRFGLLDLVAGDALATHPLLSDLGPEPLADSFTAGVLATALGGRSGPIKTALLDQHVIAGLGNIYVSESLYRAGIDPARPAGAIGKAATARLVDAIKTVLTEAIAAGGSSLRDHRRPDGELGYFQHSFAVYGREGEPCPRCDCATGVRRIVQSGRATFYCAKQQR
jgi:formamidopyrimidine-DNA glycosylase